MGNDAFYHNAEYRRELLFLGIKRLLSEHQMNRSQLVKALQNEYGFEKMTPSLFSKMFSPNSSQKQNPDIAVIFAIADFFGVTVGELFDGWSKKSLAYDLREHLTYRTLLQLLYWMDEEGIIDISRQDYKTVDTSDPGDAPVIIAPGKESGLILERFLSRYTSAKETISIDTPKGKETLREYSKMLIDNNNEMKVFPKVDLESLNL